MSAPIRRVGVAISVEALLQQWARQDAGPDGAAVVVETEIAARSRGGVEWQVSPSVAVGVLARPTALDPANADIAWLAAGLAARDALADRLGDDTGVTCCWPDRVRLAADDELDVRTTAGCGFGPGTVDHVVLTVRLGPVTGAGQRSTVADALVESLRRAAVSLDRPDVIAARYRGWCATLGADVEVSRLPHGVIRGRADDIDEAGRLVLVSPTGLRQPLAVDTITTITVC